MRSEPILLQRANIMKIFRQNNYDLQEVLNTIGFLILISNGRITVDQEALNAFITEFYHEDELHDIAEHIIGK